MLKTLLRPPALCRVCHQYHRDEHALCQHCMALVEPLGPACQICATPLPNQYPLICGACCVKQPDLDRVITYYRFTEPLRTVLHAFKYESALYCSSLMIELIQVALMQRSVIKGFGASLDNDNLDYATLHQGYLSTECLIPVPMHRKRLRERGFNQAAILTRHLSRLFNIPHDLYRCTKIIPTQPQARLSAADRKTNLKQAFHAKPLPYQHVTLIDDVYTTGATANEIARTLKRQGVKQVDLWCCARVVS